MYALPSNSYDPNIPYLIIGENESEFEIGSGVIAPTYYDPTAPYIIIADNSLNGVIVGAEGNELNPISEEYAHSVEFDRVLKWSDIELILTNMYTINENDFTGYDGFKMYEGSGSEVEYMNENTSSENFYYIDAVNKDTLRYLMNPYLYTIRNSKASEAVYSKARNQIELSATPNDYPLIYVGYRLVGSSNILFTGLFKCLFKVGKVNMNVSGTEISVNIFKDGDKYYVSLLNPGTEYNEIIITSIEYKRSELFPHLPDKVVTEKFQSLIVTENNEAIIWD